MHLENQWQLPYGPSYVILEVLPFGWQPNNTIGIKKLVAHSHLCEAITNLFEAHRGMTNALKIRNTYNMVRDDPKLLDDGREISKSRGRGWQLDPQL